MENQSLKKTVLKSGLLICLSTGLILSPGASLWAKVQNNTIATESVSAKSTPVILADHKKTALAATGQVSKTTSGEENKVAGQPTVGQSDPKGYLVQDENEDEGFSTLEIVGMSAGAAAVVIGAAALIGSSGGSSSSTSSTANTTTYPAVSDITGSWRGVGTAPSYGYSYDGTYTFSSGGGHVYDIIVNTGTLEHKTGHGTWALTANSYTLTVRNDTGSVYVGNFAADNFKSINLQTSGGIWQLSLTKK